MKAAYALLTGCLLVCLVAAPAFAQGGPDGSCLKDMAAFCPDVARGGGRMMECLFEHEKSVSPACKEHLAEMKTKMKTIEKACQDDVEIFCPEAKGGEGGIAGCLKQNSTEISVECQESMRR